MLLKMTSANWRPFCSSLTVLISARSLQGLYVQLPYLPRESTGDKFVFTGESLLCLHCAVNKYTYISYLLSEACCKLYLTGN